MTKFAQDLNNTITNHNDFINTQNLYYKHHPNGNFSKYLDNMLSYAMYVGNLASPSQFQKNMTIMNSERAYAINAINTILSQDLKGEQQYTPAAPAEILRVMPKHSIYANINNSNQRINKAADKYFV